MNQSDFEAELRREGYQIFYSGFQPGQVNPDHAHDWDARLMVIGREIKLTRDGKTETFHAGDSCAVAAGELHAEQVGPQGVGTSSDAEPPLARLVDKRGENESPERSGFDGRGPSLRRPGICSIANESDLSDGTQEVGGSRHCEGGCICARDYRRICHCPIPGRRRTSRNRGYPTAAV